MSRPRAGWISPIGRKPFLGEAQMRLRYRELLGSFSDTIPKPLQIANLLGLRQRMEARRLRDGATRRSPFAFPRS